MTVSTSTCGCVWERDPSYGDVIVSACEAHLAPVLRGHDGTEQRIPDMEARVQRILDHELDALVADACSGRRCKGIRPADPYRR